MDEEAPAERAHLPAVRLEQRLLGEQEAVVAAHGLRFLPEDDIGQIQLPGDGLRVLERLRILIVDVDDEAEKPHPVGLLQEIRQIRAVLAAAHHDQALVGPGAAHAVQMGGKAFFQRIPIAPGLFRAGLAHREHTPSSLSVTLWKGSFWRKHFLQTWFV